MDVAAEISAARRRAGLTQEQLAERAATSQPALSHYESGRREPTATTFLRLLKAAGTELEPRPAAPVLAVSRRVARERGAILEQVIGLAEALPYRATRAIEYPPIGRLYGGRAITEDA